MKKMLLASIMAVCLAAVMIVGGTYALFTSSVKEDVSVTTGDVKITSVIDTENMVLYSAAPKADAGQDFDRLDPSKYESVALTSKTTFTAGGTVAYSNKTLTLANVAPGDGVAFSVKVTNSSTIKVNYRVSVSVDKTGLSDEEAAVVDALLSVLTVGVDYAGGTNYTTVTGSSTSAWATVDAGASISDIAVKILLPHTVTNTVGQVDITKVTAKFIVTVEAVQYTA